MHRCAFILIAALAGPALAQDQPKPLKTVRIHEPAPSSPNLYAIDEDGTVRLDWPVVETLEASKADRTVLPVEQVMLAIRDGRRSAGIRRTPRFITAGFSACSAKLHAPAIA